MKRILIYLCAVMVFVSQASIALASEDLKVVNTKGGILKLVQWDDGMLRRNLVLNGKNIFDENAAYLIVKTYDFEKHTVIIFTNHLGGASDSNLSYYILKVNNGGTYKIYDTHINAYELNSNKRVGNKVIIVGRSSESVITATLDGDKLTIKRNKYVKPKPPEAVYKSMLKILDHCAYAQEFQGKPTLSGSDDQQIRLFNNEYMFKIDTFYRLCDDVYSYNKKNPRNDNNVVLMDYDDFKKRISK